MFSQSVFGLFIDVEDNFIYLGELAVIFCLRLIEMQRGVSFTFGFELL
jgi:hypothetical protein